jgi:hypothetical protein
MSPSSTTPCAINSRSAGEALIGTAPATITWFLLEYPEAPGAKALPESLLPEPVKARLSGWQKSFPAARLLFIRQEDRRVKTGIRFFLGSSDISKTFLIECGLPAYETLLEIDPSALLGGDLPAFAAYRHAPLFLVCTNGKRDPCCARHGVVAYQTLSRLNPGSVWQSSHVGGHRFAANVVVLPEGIYYGRVEDSAIEPLLRTALRRQIYLPNLRGRSSYSPAVQAAEYYLRVKTGNLDLDAYPLASEVQTDPNTWVVTFQAAQATSQHAVTVQRVSTGVQIYESCGAADTAPVMNFIRPPE